jgi:hypothetical protein
MKRLLFTAGFVVVLASVLAGSGPAGQTSAGSAVLQPSAVVIPVPPLVRVERVADESVVNDPRYPIDEWQSAITSGTHGALTRAGLSVARPSAEADAGADGPGVLHDMADRLTAGVVGSDARRSVSTTCAGQPNCVVLLQFMRVKIGKGAYWNPLSGAIAASSNSTTLYGAVIDAASGRVVWKNAVVVRNVPKPADPAMSQLIRSLLGTLIK